MFLGGGEVLSDKYMIIHKFGLTRRYIEKMSEHAKSAVEILHNEHFEVENTFIISVSFLTLLENTYLNFLDHQHAAEMFSSEIELIDEKYEGFIFELKKAISDKE